MGVGGHRHAPATLPPGKKLGTHCTGGKVGPGPIWMGVENLTFTQLPSLDCPADSDLQHMFFSAFIFVTLPQISTRMQRSC